MTTQPGRNGGTLMRSEKGETSNPLGRPKSMVSKLVADGYKRVEIADMICKMLALTMPQLKVIYLSDESPAFERMVAGAIHNDIKKGDLRNLELLLSRAHGAPKQEIETTITEKTAQEMTNDELDEAVEKALAESAQPKQLGSD